jgi:hypothetical protein
MHKELRYARIIYIISYERQKDMLRHVVKCCEDVRKRERTGWGRGKNWSNSYFFIKMMRKFELLRTLCISNRSVNTAFAEKSELTGGFIGSAKGEKTQPEATDKIKSHIEKFPTQESHYCRKT